MKHTEFDCFVKDDMHAIKSLYDSHRTPFFHFASKYQLPQETLVDIYQDAFVALRKNAMKGKLASVDCSLRTYLFGIGKNLIFQELKRKDRFTPLYDSKKISEEPIEIISLETAPELTLEQQALRQYFKTLGEKCQQVLTMFYYQGLTIDEIVETTHYQSNSVVRSQKSRCLKQLKEAIQPPHE